jgi:hypothetical protein
MSEFNSSMMCCVVGCHHYGARQDREGRLFCAEHWEERVKEDPSCQDCEPQPHCAVPNCVNPGPYVWDNEGLRWCAKHIWKVNRPDGLVHPNQAQWDAQDDIRAHGMGVTIKEKK